MYPEALIYRVGTVVWGKTFSLSQKHHVKYVTDILDAIYDEDEIITAEIDTEAYGYLD